MWLRDTPGPGGFGPSPAFGHGRAGIVLQPARTTPRPGVYSGGNAAAGSPHFWWWVALVVALALVAAVAVAVRRRR
ncbi:hypothetical protein [Actinoplanes sp. NPDC026619]|uniref:hypothetical protein n=1 Tax=Actinoplanes sp. NPDC026619 TaxID=3155798 RepID=UPI00340CDBB6